MDNLKVLLVEDNPGDARLVQDMLAEAKSIGFTVEWRQTLASGIERLSKKELDVVLLDLGLPDSPQRAASFTRVQSAAPGIPIIILTGLDDDTFAVTTVRRGAQDYLVKGRFDTDTLVRTIRYGIARRAGGEKQFTIAELAQFDGKEGRPVYIAVKGKVYDASNSRMWRTGKHGAGHLAGTDLTESIAKAPHTEDVLSRLPILGTLAKPESAQQKLLRQIDRLHPHATFVHLSIAYAVASPVAFLAWILTGNSAFDEATLFLLLLGLITVPLSFLTGIVSWLVSYEAKAARVFNVKFVFGAALFILILTTFLWRMTGAATGSGPGRYVYLVSLLVQLTLALAVDHNGKKVVYS